MREGVETRTHRGRFTVFFGNCTRFRNTYKFLMPPAMHGALCTHRQLYSAYLQTPPYSSATLSTLRAPHQPILPAGKHWRPSDSPSSRLSPTRLPPRTEAMSTTPLLSRDADTTLAAQRTLLSRQDRSLQQLSSGVSSVRGIATALDKESAAQNRLLDALALDIGQVQHSAHRATQRTSDGLRAGEVYNVRTFCMLLWPLVLLIVLLVEVVLHFLF